MGDWIGIILGAIGIGISIAIYLRQERLRRTIQKQENLPFQESLSKIRSSFGFCFSMINTMIQLTEKDPNADKKAVIRHQMNAFGDILRLQLQEIRKEMEFARPRVEPDLYNEMELRVEVIESMLVNNHPDAKGIPSDQIVTAWFTANKQLIQSLALVLLKLTAILGEHFTDKERERMKKNHKS